MGYAKAKQIDYSKIPIVDITSLRDKTDLLGVAKNLHDASKNLGFIYIKGHGIPDSVITSLRNDGLNFFRAEEKMKHHVKISKNHRGWLSYGGAKMQEGAKADLKESFLWGYQDRSKISHDDHPLMGPNCWPTFLPSLEKNAMDYFWYGDQLARFLLKGFALGLDLKENFFLKTSDAPLTRASLVYYPTQSKNLGDKQFGVSPHTDFGVLTVLCQDMTGGLQIQDLDGEWFHAPPLEGTIIVNVADLLSRWTGGEYKSTPHRVVNSSGKERISIVFAFDPNPETIIDPNEVFKGKYGGTEKPITCGDYLTWRFKKAFSYRN
jgi:isopenicillin N synthase-like dioxygenase